VVCTEEVEIHESSDLAPNIEGRLWSDADIPAMKLMVEAVHRYGALAGIELTHGGHHASNWYSRALGYGPRSIGVTGYTPGQTRRVDKQDIRDIRRWHRAAALRARQAGFDIIYCYAGHDLTLAMHFLLHRYNDRTDEYGGSLMNRTRFLRELIQDTKEAVGDRCAVAVRLAVHELLGEEGITSQGEGQEIVALLADLPDLWDVNLSDWSNDSATARFTQESYQESYVKLVKTLTSKPVVAVGRYTTPDTMANIIRRGVADLVGAARPSIADPFLPDKIRQGRIEDIRECIGCNICASADVMGIPIRCTQNPTMGEEWRRNWHPERIPSKASDKELLVLGGGPAGLECARTLGERGYQVNLLEARRELGGRVTLESRLPGLVEWRRVVDWRLTQIERMKNVSVYPSSPMTAEDILEAGFTHVVVATGAEWRRDGVGRTLGQPIPGHPGEQVFTPDDLMAGQIPAGQVLIYDDDHYYMGSVLAEFLIREGCEVSLVTPAPLVAYWSQYTLEQEHVEARLRQMGVELIPRHCLIAIGAGAVTLAHMISSDTVETAADAVVLVTDRSPRDEVYQALRPALAQGKLDSLRVIGDAEAPHIIAQAVFSGHRAAREFEENPAGDVSFLIEHVAL
jgi:dimethylamine/trimethylamine dehydrogenase